jgi:hypothetical protein
MTDPVNSASSSAPDPSPSLPPFSVTWSQARALETRSWLPVPNELLLFHVPARLVPVSEQATRLRLEDCELAILPGDSCR